METRDVKDESAKNESVTCPLCSEPHSDGPSLLLHFYAEHKQSYREVTNEECQADHDGGEETTQLSCSVCPFQSSDKESLSLHLIQHVQDEPVHEMYNVHNTFTCNQCHYETLDKDEMIQHMTESHLDKVASSDHVLDRDLTLETNILTSAMGLAAVVNKKAPPQSLSCPHCDYIGGTIGRITVHIKDKHTDIKEFKCQHCQYETSRKAHLERHVLKKHQQEKGRRFECQHCGYTSFDKWTLRRHERDKHAGVKPFKCSQCGFSTVRKHRLTLHVQNIHSKEGTT